MQSLYPQQIKAVDMLISCLEEGKRRPIIAAPTSFGKTTLASHLFKTFLDLGMRCQFIVDRVKLVNQAVDRFLEDGLDVGVVQADHPLYNTNASLQVCSVQTLDRRNIYNEPDFIIIDECHALHEYHKNIIDKYSCPIVGLSATPYTAGLGLYYDSLLVPITLKELINKKFLKRPRYFRTESPNLHGVKKEHIKGGLVDYNPGQTDKVMNDVKLVGRIVDHWLKYAGNRQTVCFAVSVAHSRHICDQFNAAGVSAVHIDGYMPDEERKIIYDMYDNKEAQIICCPQLLDTGWDHPPTSCCIDARPTQSITRHVQKIGRVLRYFEGVEDALILDHAGNSLRLGLVEDIIPESLDTSEQDAKEKDLIKKEKPEREERTCFECGYIHNETTCPVCGCRNARREKIEEINVSLIENNEKINKNIQEKQDFLAQALGYAENKGYNVGWAHHQFKEKYGEWPTKEVKKIKKKSPEKFILNWIKYKAISRRYTKHA